MKFQVPKGLFDILPYGAKEAWQTSHHWQFLENLIRKEAYLYNFQEIRTPIFEAQELFTRGVGATSDIVTKEMYTFVDKGDRHLVLRPEGTSSILRAFLEKNLQTLSKVSKLFYIAPMFRYERPQAGRYRQHHQFGVEALGIAHFEQDAEVIDLLFSLYQKLGIQGVHVAINSIGDVFARDSYKKALLQYLKPHLASLSEESQIRFEKNPLRILDSKDPHDQSLLHQAPSILEFLSPEDKAHFEGVCQTLKALHIPFQINPKIVRGLDYYNRTVFEISSSHLGAQNALGGGGRYDGFTSLFGGPSLPGVGFGTGLERILQVMLSQELLTAQAKAPFVLFIPLGEEARRLSFEIVCRLRKKEIPAEIDLSSKKIQEALQKASHVTYAVIVGDDEIAKKEVQLKKMAAREEKRVSIDHLDAYLKEQYDSI